MWPQYYSDHWKGCSVVCCFWSCFRSCWISGVKTQPATSLNVKKKSRIQYTILTVICLSSMWLAGVCLAWNSPFTWLATHIGLVAQLAPPACNQCMWEWRGRSQCSGLSQAQVQRVLCLSLGPRPSSAQHQMHYITATFNLSLSVVVMYSIWCCSELSLGHGLLLPGPFLCMAIGHNHKAWHWVYRYVTGKYGDSYMYSTFIPNVWDHIQS